MNDVIEGRPAGIAAFPAKTPDVAVDDIGFQSANAGLIETEALERFGAHVVDEDIGGPDQFPERFGGLGCL